MYPYANTRRDFLKVLGLGAASFALPRWVGAAQERRDQRAARRPNVVLIFSDDQSALDVNCYGSADLHTPNLDQLARRGTRFTQFYVSSPVCSPSRVSLLTGRYPLRAELSDNAAGHRREAGMPARQVTIAEMLKPAGYRVRSKYSSGFKAISTLSLRCNKPRISADRHDCCTHPGRSGSQQDPTSAGRSCPQAAERW